ncbi:helix-turn-helix domain-containing protein [Sabulicella glaciei]|uniref:Helix-turn-helix domain-containing protein n=1 Tax=Sabulicella glaciei TaxID=2984948 RepID=A0ABT3P1K5_9PROT|nr:helix-turn-helix domain-containing protein [Roseococcus sp. MDT2-1-1]MCW8088287.1 helix-turn-helix domain-containing protein [Roseococcus sp. MDT2-1-1]
MNADRYAVLAALSTYADDQGFCFPSQATLARWLKRSRPWVNQVIADLARLGFLEKTQWRRNDGGMSSCRYRLLDDLAPVAQGAVAAMTGRVRQSDRGCQPGDRNQPKAEQNQNPPAAARATGPSRSAAEEATSACDLVPVPKDWVPSTEDLDAAARLAPQADLSRHTAKFVSRCQAKGYRYRAESIGAAWLSWLIEDLAREQRPAAPPASPRLSGSKAEWAEERLAAWAAASHSPPVRPAFLMGRP